MSTEFSQFLRGLAADPRLGRYVPAPLERQTPETVVLSLVVSLADAAEGNRPHPAHLLLEELDAAPCAR